MRLPKPATGPLTVVMIAVARTTLPTPRYLATPATSQAAIATPRPPILERQRAEQRRSGQAATAVRRCRAIARPATFATSHAAGARAASAALNETTAT